MPGSDTSSASVSISFANNFWGKDDAGVEPLIQRMQNAKTTCDELKNFYSVRAAIEEDYAKKLLSLARKPFGSCESGTLKVSMDTLRAETEASGKAHQNVAQQMKSDLEEPLARYTGSLRERRKLIQGGIEKLLKVKITQTQNVNRTRDRYEQDCLRIKGYLAQGHMVMGQEERKNKAKLEKTQANLVHTNADYQNAIKALEETTERWNREWKAACDVFQDLEEERIDTLKSSLWSFSNIASTVCVSDDASCEKVRVALENCEVEKDITAFIRDKGTGHDIPPAPKYINFSRGDGLDDNVSIISDSPREARFPRAGHATYRSSSPNPSTYSQATTTNGNTRRRSSATSHSTHDPSTPGHRPESSHGGGESEYSAATSMSSSSNSDAPRRGGTLKGPSPQKYPPSTHHYGSGRDSASQVTSPTTDDQGSVRKRGFFGGNSPFSRRKSKSEKHNVLQQQQQQLRQQQLQQQQLQQQQLQQQQQQHSMTPRPLNPQPPPQQSQMTPPGNRNTWSPEAQRGLPPGNHNGQRPQPVPRQSQGMMGDNGEPVDPRASFQLNVGENVFDVAPPDGRPNPRPLDPKQPQQGQDQQQAQPSEAEPELHPIELALAELKGLSSPAATNSAPNANPRKTADRFYGMATPAPNANGNGSSTTLPLTIAGPAMTNTPQQRNTPPPLYTAPLNPKRSALDAPAPAHTSAAMQSTLRKYRDQTAEYMLDGGPPQMPGVGGHNGSGPPSRTGSGTSMRDRANTVDYNGNRQQVQGRNSGEVPRAASPNPMMMNNNRSVSPRPGYDNNGGRYSGSPNPQQQYDGRAPSPNPYHQQPPPQQYQQYQARPNTANPQQPQYKRASTIEYYQAQTQQQQAAMRGRSPSPNPMMNGQGGSPASYRPYSPNPQTMPQQQMPQRPRSQHGGSFSMQPNSGGMQMDAHTGAIAPRNRNTFYGNPDHNNPSSTQLATRPRSRSVVGAAAGGQQYGRDGRPIIFHARAMYMYNAAIPEELSFGRGDIMAVLRIQDDGWWEAEVMGQVGGAGLVPSNYLQRITPGG